MRLFSQPQPLAVVTQSGYKVPYQLHCWPETELDTEDELTLELVLLLDDELEDETAPATCKKALT